MPSSKVDIEKHQAPSMLLELPDTCLLEVLQYCVDDPRSLFRAARAHSRLRKAAVAAMRNIKAELTEQRQLDSVLLYLASHGRQIGSLDLRTTWSAALYRLPSNLQPSSLHLSGVRLRQPVWRCGGGFWATWSLLWPPSQVAALTQLQLANCRIDSIWGSAPGCSDAALSELPAGLQHLGISNLHEGDSNLHEGDRPVRFWTGVLQRLQQLTYLELVGVQPWASDQSETGLALQPLTALTRLADLRLGQLGVLHQAGHYIPASLLSGSQHLTRLELSDCSVEPGVLAGKTQLQHLQLAACYMSDEEAGEAQLLSLLHGMQLTHLTVEDSLVASEEGVPPAAAYAALTASSKLQYLNIRSCSLPANVWQHMFPVGRRLPHLRQLNMAFLQQPGGAQAVPPAGSCLVSCCPGLQTLQMNLL